MIAIGAIVLWLIGGVRPDELARYLGYEAVFVVAPGWLVLRALAPEIRGWSWQLALGWPLGLTLEILAFALTAALGARDLFFAYPLLVAVPAALVILRRGGGLALPGPPSSALFTRGCRWTLAGLCLLAFAYVGVAYFTATPLPGSVPGIFYPTDITFQIAVAASALHHWPPVFLGIVGQHFRYHYFVDLHMAAISKVTGIHLPLVVFRLYLLPLIALLVLEVSLLGRVFAGRAWAGPLTVALFLLVRELDLIVGDAFPFGGIGMFHLWGSPSQLLGMTLFVPALLVLLCLLDPGLSERASPHLGARRKELWALLALLLIGAGGAKSAILPVLIGGLLLYLLWTRLRDRSIDRGALAALGLCLLIFAVLYVLMYSGGSSLGLRINPPATIKQMLPLQRVHAQWPGGLAADAVFWILAVPVGTAMYFGAPLLGLIWILRRPRPPLEPAAVLSLSLLLVGAAAFFFLYDEFLEQTYFTLFGLIAVLPLSAQGLMQFFDAQVRRPRLSPRGLAIFAVCWLAAVVVLALIADGVASDGHPLRADLLVYLPIAAAITGLAFAASRAGGGLRALLASLAVGAVLLTAVLDVPLDVIPNTVRQLGRGKPLYRVSPAGGLRPVELEGMDWIRDHIPQDAVLAVSNDRTRRTRQLGPLDVDYPAFTEHRTLDEGWTYSIRANEIGQHEVTLGHKDPFPERTALERAVFRHGDRAALRTMVERYGVRYVVVSKKDGPVSRRLYREGHLVYSNGAVDVIQVA